MAYLLDTNACSDYFTGRYPRVVARIQACSPDDLRLSVVSEFGRVKGLEVENWRE
jgi:predicted nucleic acid-binding protein